ncbi:MAG: cell wall-binding repeat-containing protein [bacterium]|nr:cell wall-binding repeat-containing protein [bacterium]
MKSSSLKGVYGIGLAAAMLAALAIFVLPQGQPQSQAQAAEQDVVPTIKAALATVEYKVGPGQQYGSLQAAIDAIPATPTSNYTLSVYPGTYVSETTLTGKNNGPAGAVITIKNAQSAKPVLSGAAVPSNWSKVSGTVDVYQAPVSGAKMVTDGVERLNKVSSLNDVKRQRNVWYTSGGKVYVRLLDYVDPNTRPIYVTTGANGLRVINVPNVLIVGLKVEHYVNTGILFDNAGNSSARSVWVNDIGDRGAGDAGILFQNSPNDSALNIIGTTIYGAAIRAVNSASLDVYNASVHHAVNGIELSGSTGALLQNNIFGSAMQNPVKIDNASRSGLTTRKNTYWNPSGALGEVADAAKYTVSSLGASAGGESGSSESDPRYRSTTTRESDKTNFLHNKVRDLDAALFGGDAWSNNTNAANLRWDQGFMFEAYLDMYRGTKDVRWLEKIVDQADTVWSNCYDNAASPGTSDDGYCGWSTSRYARAMLKPSTTTSSNSAGFKLLDSGGSVVSGNIGIYGPGNGDTVKDAELEIRFPTSHHRYEVWRTSGTPVCLNCPVTADNYPGGISNVQIDDAAIESAVGYDVRFIFSNSYPWVGDVYKLQTKAKKQLEYENIEGGMLAPLIEFAVEVKSDPTLHSISAGGSTLLTKANEYVTLVGDNIYPKWEPYFKASYSAGWNGGSGGVYTWPTDEQYAIPGNTLPVNQSTDLAQLWVRMYQATGETKYFTRAQQVAAWFKSKLEVKTAPDGQQYYYWRYYYPSGSWDSWSEVIPEDVNHGGTVLKFVTAAREAGITFSTSDLELFGNTFSSQLWDPNSGQIYWYLNRTTPGSIASRIYYFHTWLEMPGNENIAKLVYDTYANNSFYTTTGVVYQMMADAALNLSRQEGAQNYKVRSGSSAVRAGSTHGYDKDFDGRSRSQLGEFDRGAYSYILLDRLQGANRYATSVAISQSQFAQDDSAGAVFLARGDNFADGLAGAPLAAQENAPILLTETATLPAEVAVEIERVLPSGGNVWLLGGTSAISTPVEEQLSSLGYQVQRLAGDDRYATAVAVAEKLNNLTEVFLASGTSFPDALAASSVAARDRAAIVLTSKADLPDVTRDFLASTPATTIHIVGGVAVVEDDVASDASAYGTVDRIAGSNRYDTAVQIAQTFYPGAETVGFATGTNFPDALVAGPLLGSQQVLAPLLLVLPGEVPDHVTSYLSANGATVIGGVIFGGSSAISSGVESSLESSL